MKPMGLLRCACLAFSLGGCVLLGYTQATRFYMLNPLTHSDIAPPSAVEPPQAQQRVSVALAPVAIPRYLDRPQIVTRISANELNLAEFDQWAEPLSDNVTRVLAENLTRLLSTHGIDVLSEPSAHRSAYRLGVTLRRFERGADNECVLQANWTLVEEGDPSGWVENAFDVRIPLDVPGYEAMVGAMSRALGALSRDIALRLRAAVMHGDAG